MVSCNHHVPAGSTLSLERAATGRVPWLVHMRSEPTSVNVGVLSANHRLSVPHALAARYESTIFVEDWFDWGHLLRGHHRRLALASNAFAQRPE